MNRKKRVLVMLKPKVRAFGFNEKELKSIAAKIADNLTSEEDASDEDVDAEIEKSIDAAIPYLQAAQSYANRVIEYNRKKNEQDDEPDDDDGETDDDDEPSRTKPHKGSRKNNSQNRRKENDVTPEWAKGLLKTVETLTSEITVLKGEKVATTRKIKLEALLKDTGIFGKRTLKDFARMKFEDEEEFDEYYSDVEEELKAYNQERVDAGLASLTNPPAAGGKGSGIQKKEEMSDDELKALVGTF